MSLAIFENYTSTSDKTIDKFWHPIKINIDFDELKTALINHYKDSQYEENDFGEILFYVNGFEITFALSKVDSVNHVLNISVYSKKKRGQTRACLEETIEMIRAKFKLFILK